MENKATIRNKNVDIFRACSLLMVLIYYCWVLLGSEPYKLSVVNLIVSLGGEIGVTAFFVLSGYGIYYSLRRMDSSETGINYKNFLLKRFMRIAPQYYLSILFVILIGNAGYVSTRGIRSIILHLLFAHNLLPGHHGSINGALWTMGVIVQFYLVSPLLYKGIKKLGIFFGVISIAFTIGMKFFAYHYLLPAMGREDLAFFSGRQLITALDNFVIGMCIAYIVLNKKKIMNNFQAICLSIISIAAVIVVCNFGRDYGIHTNNLSGYTWHSLLALALGVEIYCISNINLKKHSFVYRRLLHLSKFEYEIYVWHLPIINNLINNSSLVQSCRSIYGAKILYIPLIILVILVGYCIGGIVNRAKIFHDQSEVIAMLTKVKKIVFIGIAVFCLGFIAVSPWIGKKYIKQNTQVVTADNSNLNYPLVFDADYYAKINTDVAQSVGTEPEALLNHFIQYGMDEGRVSSPNFNIHYYMEHNPDIVEQYGENTRFYYIHYMLYGYQQNRECVGQAQ